jgi:tetratricopeptide (TPR) repeat protein
MQSLMSKMKTTFAAPIRIKTAVCLSIIFWSILGVHIGSSKAAPQAHSKAATAKKPEKQGQLQNEKVLRSMGWRQTSYLSENLMDHKKFIEAENLLNSILPQAKKDAPGSVDYALTLTRLGSALYALKKYPQSATKLQEAITILSQNPPSARQRQILWRSMGTRVAALLALKKNAEAEALARRTVAYAIAFPGVATDKQMRIAYLLLNKSLQAQKKFEEAKKIQEIMNSP